MNKFKKIVDKLDTIVGYGACLMIFLNMLIVTVSVIARLTVGFTVSGITDVVGFVSAIAAALSLGYTEKENGFISVDFVKEYFPRLIRHLLHIVVGVMSIAVLGVLSYRFILYGKSCYELGTISWVMYIPYWPICFLLVLGCLCYCVTSIYHFVEEITKWKEDKQ